MSTTIPATSNKRSYIPSIDGLRAVAVILVLLFHLDIAFVQNGFIGVDVFFVISGYLITRNIVHSFEEKKFSFLNFYFRRAARLMPSVLTVVLVTLIAGHFFLTPQDYNRLGFSSFLSSISLSNIFFWTEAGYFAQGSDTKPLLHTWSLAVEEQFYLIWPIFLIFCLGVSRKFLAVAMLVMGAISLIGAIYFHRGHPDMVFFLAPFRVFQFAIGGLINFVPEWKSRNHLSFVGLLSVVLLFFLAAILPNDQSGFTHVTTVMLIPALLAGAFILSARSKIQEVIFSSLILKYIGDRSYSIYLVHWPIIVYWNMATDYVLSPLEQVGLLTASVVLGEILHKFVEKPLRLPRSAKSEKVLKTKIYLLVSGVITAFLSINVTYFDGFGKLDGKTANITDNTPIAERIEQSNNEPVPGRCFMRAQDQPNHYSIEKCATAPAGNAPRVLVFGDSYAGDVYVAMKVGYKEPYFGHFVVPGCSLETPAKALANKNQCQAHYDYAYKNVITRDKFDYVVLVSNWVRVSDEDIVATRDYFEALGIKTVVIGLRPRFRERVPDIYEKAGDAEAAKKRANALFVAEVTKRSQLMAEKAEEAGSYMDLMILLCPKDCDIESSSGDLLYRDESHFTLKGSSWLGRELKKTYPDVFQ